MEKKRSYGKVVWPATILIIFAFAPIFYVTSSIIKGEIAVPDTRTGFGGRTAIREIEPRMFWAGIGFFSLVSIATLSIGVKELLKKR